MFDLVHKLFIALKIGIAFLIVSLPVYVIIYFLNKNYLKQSWLVGKKLRLYFGLSILFLTIYSVYDYFNPTDTFYKRDFKNHSKIDFPNSGKIIKSESRLPNYDSEYSASALFQVNNKDFYLILNQVKANKNFQSDTSNYAVWKSKVKAVETYILDFKKSDGFFTIYFHKNSNQIKYTYYSF